MAAKREDTIWHPVFGEINRDTHYGCWEGGLRLPAFAEYFALNRESLDIVIHDQAGKGPSPAQEKAARYLVRNESKICQAAMDAVYRNYRETHRDCSKDNSDLPSGLQQLIKMVAQHYPPPPKFAEFATPVESPEELKKLIQLLRAHFHVAAKAGYSLVGFSFHSEYEVEHGVGVLTHRADVIDVGHMDVSFTE